MTATLSVPALAKDADLELLIEAAQKEGAVGVGMPDSWANWKGTWTANYGLKHQDTDMSSAQEISKFEATERKLLLYR